MTQEAELLAALDRLVEPLRGAGWTLRERRIERGFGADVSAIGELDRNSQRIDMECFADGTSQFFAGDESRENDPGPPLFQALSDADALVEFGVRGWV